VRQESGVQRHGKIKQRNCRLPIRVHSSAGQQLSAIPHWTTLYATSRATVRARETVLIVVPEGIEALALRNTDGSWPRAERLARVVNDAYTHPTRGDRLDQLVYDVIGRADDVLHSRHHGRVTSRRFWRRDYARSTRPSGLGGMGTREDRLEGSRRAGTALPVHPTRGGAVEAGREEEGEDPAEAATDASGVSALPPGPPCGGLGVCGPAGRRPDPRHR
jgi:hypothetical protein